MAKVRFKNKKDTRTGGIPKYPVKAAKTPARYKKGPSWEKAQSEYTNRRARWRGLSGDVRRRMRLYEDYSWERVKKTNKRSRQPTTRPMPTTR